ncbi:chaoptin isoform X2 [Culicoides brevitarsis]|uniref:chaoptin isoform X2 n=1 Tax=Culicoides brevitarsis TaxID=469753 RepID=UPI00307C3422
MKVELIHFLRAGYVVMFLTLFLMMWASMVGAVGTFDTESPRNPCSFNPLCTCSKTPPDLGMVECRYVPFAEIPQEINSSKVFSLHMEKTGLQELEPYFLRPTGLYRLEITDNPIQHIPDEAFSGLDRSLSILKLTFNRLTEIPSQAMRHLRKLQYVDFSGNVIQELRNDAWRGLEDSLQTIILAGNLIPALPTDAFSSLPLLETIDLSGNNLMEIEKDVFRDGMARLKNVILADNLLSSIPYSPLAPLKALRMLDLSYNRISTFAPDEVELKSVRLNLNALHLEYNQITSIPPESFGNFDVLNMTYLDGNPINVISEGAFKNARIRELYMRNCKLHYISPEAFVSLESSLQVLDLSGNNITSLPEKIFSAFDSLKILSLRDNKFLKIVPTELFMALQPTLHKLDLTGDNMPSLILQDLRRLRNLRSLAISRLAGQSIGPEDFLEYGYELEDLKIYKAGLKSIRNNAFREIRTIKRLDLSENNINSIENDAFKEVGHSLLSLRISRGLSMDTVPVAAFKALKSLEELDLTNNRLSKVPDTSFHNLKNLRVVEMHDNMIDQLSKGTFQGDLHHNLEIVSFAFNSIRHVSQHTFVDLKSLKKVRLEDNKIERIERKAFMNLDKLRTINLRGNKINSISDEAFQNLQSLEYLDMAYNSLSSFDFDYFDQVGSISSLRVNVSYNKITDLRDNVSSLSVRDHSGSVFHSNIKQLDLSHNNISNILGGFFRPAEISLTHLYLGHNYLTNISRDVFGSMPHLQWLDLSHNRIFEIDYDTFKNTKRLQVINLSNNGISDVPMDLFRFIRFLRVVDLSHNFIRGLTENFFGGDGMELLDLSYNKFMRVPALALSNLAALTLCELDLSHNHIAAIQSMCVLQSLVWLDLSHNELIRLEDAAFATLPRLSYLDLSHNQDLEVNGRAFIGLENTLLELKLQNISTDVFPELSFNRLQSLSLAFNELPTIPQQIAENLTSLRKVDLSYNDLTMIPEMVKSLPELRSLSLSGNPITTLTNATFHGIAEDLSELYLSNLDLKEFEAGTFNHLYLLRTLEVSAFPGIQKFNVPKMVEHSLNLRTLILHGPQTREETSISKFTDGISALVSPRFSNMPASDFSREMIGNLPFKVRKVVFEGHSLNRVAEDVLKGIQSPVLHVVFKNTSLTALPDKIFNSLEHVRNITVDFTHTNKQLKKVANPNTAHYPNIAERTFLTELNIDGMSLTCDCELGWVEFWQRKTRQYVCTSQTWADSTFNHPFHALNDRESDVDHLCNEHSDLMRTATCSNKGNSILIEVTKNDLECGWGSGASSLVTHISVVLIFGITFTSLLI